MFRFKIQLNSLQFVRFQFSCVSKQETCVFQMYCFVYGFIHCVNSENTKIKREFYSKVMSALIGLEIIQKCIEQIRRSVCACTQVVNLQCKLYRSKQSPFILFCLARQFLHESNKYFLGVLVRALFIEQPFVRNFTPINPIRFTLFNANTQARALAHSFLISDGKYRCPNE